MIIVMIVLPRFHGNHGHMVCFVALRLRETSDIDFFRFSIVSTNFNYGAFETLKMIALKFLALFAALVCVYGASFYNTGTLLLLLLFQNYKKKIMSKRIHGVAFIITRI